MNDGLNRTLMRGLEMLERLGERRDGMELSEIAREMDIPKSSAHNLVKTLLEMKYVYQESENGRYFLGLKMYEVGAAAVNSLDITRVIRRYMTDVFKMCNETMHCGMLSGDEVLYIDKMESTHSIRMTSRIGVRMPLHATAMGKAMLACMNDEKINEILEKPLESLTPHTIVSPERLRAEIEKIRTDGFAVEREECNELVCCVGVAIKDASGQPRYALSISAPKFRFSETEESAYRDALMRAAGKIEKILKAL